MKKTFKSNISIFFCAVFVMFSVCLAGTTNLKKKSDAPLPQVLLPATVYIPQEEPPEEAAEKQEAFLAAEEENRVQENFFVTVHDVSSGEIFSMDFENYVLGALLSEMPTSFSPEALKAQAVACRSYALYRSQSPHSNGAQLCTSPAHCQAFCPPDSVSPERYEKAYNAVFETKGEIMLFDGKPVLAVFHASSEGKTRSSVEVWGGSLAYLSSVETAEAYNPTMDISKSYTFSKEVFAEKLGVSVPCLSEIYLEKNSSGRVSVVHLSEKDVSGKDFVGIFSLRSQAFDIKIGENDVLITCKGYGHGVGMSQYGAQDMAQKGYGYKEILSHYYTGVTLGYM